MRITQGTFSFLPDLTDEQIAKQVDYALAQGWADGCRGTRGGEAGRRVASLPP